MKDNNYFKELKMWLCASLKNSNAELCECGKEDKEIVELINNIQIQLQEINNNLEILKQYLISYNNSNNNIHDKNNNNMVKKCQKK